MYLDFPSPYISRTGVRALQQPPFHSSAGLRHVAFTGDQVWASRKHREKKDKKIGPNENQKHRLSFSFSPPTPPRPWSPSLPWTWREEREGELNLIQTSSPQQQMTRLWSVSVRVWVFHSLHSFSSAFFLWTSQESLQCLQFNLVFAGLMQTAASIGHFF